MTEKILQLNNDKAIFKTLIGVLLLCAGFYIYCINATVHNVVARQNLENEASTLTLALGSKEFQYITAKGDITLAYAHDLGFHNVVAKTFVSRKSVSQVSYLPR